MDWCIHSEVVDRALMDSKTISTKKYKNYSLVFTFDAKKESKQLLKIKKKHLYTYFKKYWEWNSLKMLQELTLNEMRYVLVYKTGSEDIVGYASYTFIHEHEPNTNVLYLFELHTCTSHRGQGLGNLIMEHLELIAKLYKLQEIRLTCFCDNKAYQWYLSKSFHINYECSKHVHELKKKI